MTVKVLVYTSTTTTTGGVLVVVMVAVDIELLAMEAFHPGAIGSAARFTGMT